MATRRKRTTNGQDNRPTHKLVMSWNVVGAKNESEKRMQQIAALWDNDDGTLSGRFEGPINLTLDNINHIKLYVRPMKKTTSR